MPVVAIYITPCLNGPAHVQNPLSWHNKDESTHSIDNHTSARVSTTTVTRTFDNLYLCGGIRLKFSVNDDNTFDITSLCALYSCIFTRRLRTQIIYEETTEHPDKKPKKAPPNTVKFTKRQNREILHHHKVSKIANPVKSFDDQ